LNLSWYILLAVGSGGFLGSLCRFYINTIISQKFPHEIIFATLTTNILGSFLMGILAAIFMHYTPADAARGFLVTGFLGALTTYSTFALESYFLLNSSFWYAIINISLNLFGTIIAAGSGYKIMQLLLR